MNYVKLLIDVIQLFTNLHNKKVLFINLIVVRFGFIKQPIPLILFNILWTFLLCYFYAATEDERYLDMGCPVMRRIPTGWIASLMNCRWTKWQGACSRPAIPAA